MKGINYINKYLNKHQNLLEEYTRESNKIADKIEKILVREGREVTFSDKTLGNYMLLEGKIKGIPELKEKIGLSIENNGDIILFLKTGGQNEYQEFR